MTLTSFEKRIRNGIILSALAGITDGKFCRTHGKGADMVQLGGYSAIPEGSPLGPGKLPTDMKETKAFFKSQIDEVRKENQKSKSPLVCVNVVGVDLAHTARCIEAFAEAGGDVFEINTHSKVEKYLQAGLGMAMFLKENRERLYGWTRELSNLSIPFIVKGRRGVIDDYEKVIPRLQEAGAAAFHINIRDPTSTTPDLKLLRKIRESSSIFLIASGYVRDTESARALFDSGADAVGVGAAVIEDPTLIARIKKELR